MKFKGTKGNWRVRNGNGLLFVESPKEDLGTPYGQEILADDYFNEDEKIHDCNLVAAAPELLEALQAMLSRFKHSDEGMVKAEYVKRMAEVAILKALGKNKVLTENGLINP